MPRAPTYSYEQKWWMFDMANFQLIINDLIPDNLSSSQNVIVTGRPIPGLGYEPTHVSRIANEKLSFTLPLLRKNNTVGNLLLLKQFERLREQTSLLSQFTASEGRFQENPTVLYNWGTGKVPLVYKVAKCDFVHESKFINQIGLPQYTKINFELILDKTNLLYQAERIFRDIVSLGGIYEGYKILERSVRI